MPNVSRRSTTNIAFAYTGEMSVGSPFDAALMQGFSEGMEAHGFDLIVLDVARAKLPDETFSQMFVRKGIRRPSSAPPRRPAQFVCRLPRRDFPPLSSATASSIGTSASSIRIRRLASREAIEHLIGLGHKRIGIAINVVDDSDHADRLAGYCQALEAHSIAADERLILRAPGRCAGGEQLMRRVWTMPERPTALYIADPMSASVALNEAQSIGVQIPGDLSLVGFDDSELRFLVHPRMTAVCQDAVEMAKVSTLLHAMLKPGNRGPTEKIAALLAGDSRIDRPCTQSCALPCRPFPRRLRLLIEARSPRPHSAEYFHQMHPSRVVAQAVTIHAVVRLAAKTSAMGTFVRASHQQAAEYNNFVLDFDRETVNLHL